MSERGETQSADDSRRLEGGPVRMFLSYRRSDTEAYAGRLYDSLAARFGEENVFMDIDSIDPGADFAETIRDTLQGCDVLLALIGPDWLTITDGRGRRRLEAPRDWVRLEIQAALKMRVPVIPVLVRDAAMPARTDLPRGITRLARLQAFEIGPRWRADVTRLGDAIETAARRNKAPLAQSPTELRPPATGANGPPEAPAPGRADSVAVPASASPPVAPPLEPAAAPVPTRPPPSRRLAVVIGIVAAAVVVALAVLLLAGGGGDDGRAVETSVAVPGRATWTDTGVDLTAGAQVTVAAGGEISSNVAFPDQSAKVTGPGGTAGTAGDPFYKSVLPGTNHAALIAKIGETGAAFPLTPANSFTADRSGRLFLGVNDLEPCNNGGEFAATIRGNSTRAKIGPRPTPTTVAPCV